MQFSTILTWFVPATLLLIHTSTATAIPQHHDLATRDTPTNKTGVIPFPFDEVHTPYLGGTFDVIASIPDTIIASGETAVKKWIKDHTPAEPPRQSTREVHDAREAYEAREVHDGNLEARTHWWTIANCVLTILKVLASDEFPLAKILRIKQLISDLGGGYEVAKLILKAKHWADLIRLGGQELKDLADLLLGVQSIQSSCFQLL